MEKNNKLLSQEDIMNLLDSCYSKVLDGVPYVSPTVEEFANDYLQKYTLPEEACKAMIKNQIIKCTTSGFLTGFGGIVTLPITLPANIGSVLYVQMRMIACTAYMAGLELNNDQTQTFVYACLAGVAVNELIKQAGIKFGMKLTTSLIKKIPGKVLTKINQKVGFRFITKFGTKGIINMGKLVPGVGAVIGGGLDLVETKAIGNRAFQWFFEGNYINSEDNEGTEYEVIEIENVSDTTDMPEKETKIDFSEIGNTVSQGIKNASAGLSNLFSKKNKASSEEDNLDKIKKLKELLDMGAITQEEFVEKKKELLDL